jgi:hypothetical protein
MNAKHFTKRININLPAVHTYVACVLLLFISVAAPTLLAQSAATGNIHGRVADSSGHPIANVAITLTSPAILQPRTSTSDATGSYHFEQLPIGTYKMVLDDTGFEQFVRENIDITALFSAEVNVQLTVGSVSQTVTVSGAGPVVDTTSTTVSTAISANVISNQLPVAHDIQEIIAVVPGVMPTQSPDLGGGILPSYTLEAYGISGQSTPLIEGLNTRKSAGNSEAMYDYNTLEEMQVVPTGAGADVALPGVYVSAIVKTGGNSFHGRGEYSQEPYTLEGNNLTPLLRSQGNTFPNVILGDEVASLNGGGSLHRDRWWLFAGVDVNNNHRSALGFLLPNGQNAQLYIREANSTVKSTFQLSKNYKVIGFWTAATAYAPNRGGSSTVPLQNVTLETEIDPEWKGEFEGTPSSSLVLDFFAGHHRYEANYTANPDPLGIPTMVDSTTGNHNGPSLGQDKRGRHNSQVTGSVAYLPNRSMLGHHEFKFGYTWMFMYEGTKEPDQGVHGNYQLTFSTIGGVPGTPTSIQFYNYPLPNNRQNLDEGGFYAMDTWRISKRITINAGLRFDTFSASVPAQTKPGGPFGTPWLAPAAGTNQNIWTGGPLDTPNVPTGSWKTVAPRIGLVWDTFGDGKTVLKASYGRYDWTPGDDYATPFNVNAVTISSYSWTPTLGAGTCTESLAAQGQCDYVPGSVNLNPDGPQFQSLQGGSNGAVAKLADSVLNPNQKQQYSNIFQLFAERELRPGLSVRLGYTYIENLNTWLQIPIDIPYSAWTIPYVVHDGGPTTASCLPTTKVTCPTTGRAFTVYDFVSAYKGTSFAQTEYVNRPSSAADHVGTIEATLVKRGGSGKWTVLTGYTANNQHIWVLPSGGNNGFNGQLPIPVSPNELLFPLNTTWAWQARVSGNYQLPYKFDISSLFQIYNGLQGQRTETYALPNAGAITVPVEPFGAETGPIRPLLNFRFARDFRMERYGTLRPSFEILNATNSAAPWAITYASGPRFNYYTTTDTPRIYRFGVVYTW